MDEYAKGANEAMEAIQDWLAGKFEIELAKELREKWDSGEIAEAYLEQTKRRLGRDQ